MFHNIKKYKECADVSTVNGSTAIELDFRTFQQKTSVGSGGRGPRCVSMVALSAA